jgi:hypothetical protein
MRYFVLLLLSVAFSCAPKTEGVSGDSEDSAALQAEPLTFKIDSLNKEVCVGENCAKIRLLWPVASGSKAADNINAVTRDQLALLMQTGEDAAPLDTLIRDFFKTFKDFKTEFPDAGGGWEIEAEGQVSYQSDSTLSIRFSQFNFMGGAHPNSSVSFLNFDPRTGEFLGDDQVILDESVLFEKVEQKFRAFHQVAEGKSLKEDDRFFLPEIGFFVADAKGFKDGKFWVIYQPYEIGPYVMGYTELEFSPEELKGIVRW